MSDDERRAALRARIDTWIADGAKTNEPAIALLANMSMPPDVGVFDDAIARAGNPPIGELYLARAMLLMFAPDRAEDVVADFERADRFAPDDMRRNLARSFLAQHYHANGDVDKAIEKLQQAIAVGNEELARQDRGTLATWLAERGDHAAALAIRTDMVATASPEQRD